MQKKKKTEEKKLSRSGNNHQKKKLSSRANGIGLSISDQMEQKSIDEPIENQFLIHSFTKWWKLREIM